MSNELFRSLAPHQLKSLRVIGWAIGLGALVFAGIATAVPFVTGGPSPTDGPPDASVVRILSMVHGALFLSGLAMALVVSPQLAKRVPEGQEHGLFILRWAMIEGSALLGSVVVLLAGMDGILPDQPVYYANLLSAVVLVVFVVTDTGRLSDAARGE